MRKPLTPFHLREVMDEAVRRLAVSAASIQERLQNASAVMMGALLPTDFGPEEDRELFLKIHDALAQSVGEASPSRLGERTDGALEQIAADILDLRDTIMGRALREARMSTPHRRARGEA